MFVASILIAADWSFWWPFREPVAPPNMGGVFRDAVTTFVRQVYWTGALHGGIVVAIILILLYLVAQLLSPTQLRKRKRRREED